MKDTDARQAVEVHGLEGAVEIRDYVLSEVERRQRTSDPVRDVGAYMVCCFQGGFGKRSDEERAAAEQRQRAATAKQEREAARKRIQIEAERLKSEFWRHQTERVDERLAALTAEARQGFEERFMRRHPEWAQRYRENGLDSMVVRSLFYGFGVETLLGADEPDVVAFAQSRGAASPVLKALQTP